MKVTEAINRVDRGMIETKEEWRDWAYKMPGLRFDEDWDVSVVPPFGGALARFLVSKGDNEVSVYFDAYCQLGFVVDDDNNAVPYFEIYPNAEGENERFGMDETDKMMKAIRQSLNKRCRDAERNKHK